MQTTKNIIKPFMKCSLATISYYCKDKETSEAFLKECTDLGLKWEDGTTPSTFTFFDNKRYNYFSISNRKVSYYSIDSDCPNIHKKQLEYKNVYQYVGNGTRKHINKDISQIKKCLRKVKSETLKAALQETLKYWE